MFQMQAPINQEHTKFQYPELRDVDAQNAKYEKKYLNRIFVNYSCKRRMSPIKYYTKTDYTFSYNWIKVSFQI